MARVHAYVDDALGDLDAVGLAEAIRSRRRSIPEVVEAAIARTQRVSPELNALAAECFEPARAEAVAPRGGYFAGVPTFVKDNSDLAGLPTMQGTDAFAPVPAEAERRLRPDAPGDRRRPARQDPVVGVRVQRLCRAPAARVGALTVVDRAHGRRLVVRVGSARGRRGRAPRARQRRRWLDPHPGCGQRPGRPQADAGPSRAGPDVPTDADPPRGRRRRDALGARHGGVPARGGEGLPRPPARTGRRRHARHAGPSEGRGVHRRHRHEGDARGRRS